jgi:plastin-1
VLFLTGYTQNGVAILEAFDKVSPGSVVWRRVSKPRNVPGSLDANAMSGGEEEEEETGVTPNMPQLSRFKCVENTNYAVDLAKANGMHLVGIQGADIVDGKKTLVLGLVWQLMR